VESLRRVFIDFVDCAASKGAQGLTTCALGKVLTDNSVGTSA
jgi:hypothetical protein